MTKAVESLGVFKEYIKKKCNTQNKATKKLILHHRNLNCKWNERFKGWSERQRLPFQPTINISFVVEVQLHCFFTFRTGWRWDDSVTPHLLCLLEISPWHQLDRRLGRPQCLSGCSDKGKNLHPHQELNSNSRNIQATISIFCVKTDSSLLCNAGIHLPKNMRSYPRRL